MRVSLLLVVGLLLTGCAQQEFYLVVCGERVPCAARVIPFTDPQGFDAHSEQCLRSEVVLPSHPVAGTDTARRYGTRSTAGLSPAASARVASSGWDRAALQERVDQFVMHYDACQDSSQCFEVLHDQRGLSVHFLLDLDGTIYQTLDLAHRARHATRANDRSIGIEIANLGAYADGALLDRFYRADEAGSVWLQLPRQDGRHGFRRTGALTQPARAERMRGVINGRALQQHDFTEAQYRSLEQLVDAVRAVLPRIAATAPCDAAGQPLARMLTPEEFTNFSGILGHFHVQEEKSDPGPGFDWTRILRAAANQDAHGMRALPTGAPLRPLEGYGAATQYRTP